MNPSRKSPAIDTKTIWGRSKENRRSVAAGGAIKNAENAHKKVDSRDRGLEETLDHKNQSGKMRPKHECCSKG